MTNHRTPEPQGQPYEPAGPQAETTEFQNNGYEQDYGQATVPATTNEPVDHQPVASEETKAERTKVKGSAAGSTWVALIIGTLLLILLLVFILQNQQSVKLQLFAWEMNFPIGVGMLIAAIVGALIMALVGGVRMIQLRRQVTHRRK